MTNLAEDPKTWWFWLKPEHPFEIRYAPNWQAKLMGFVGPFSFRACAERERVDRLLAGVNLRLIGGTRKEA